MSDIINFLDLVELKKTLKEKFETILHIHDTCGGQFFSLENINPESKEYIVFYFENKNYRVIFDNDKEFHLKETRKC